MTNIMSIKLLKGVELFTRIHCVLLTLSNSYLIEKLCSRKTKRGVECDKILVISNKLLVKLGKVLEDTFLFHLGLKNDIFKVKL